MRWRAASVGLVAVLVGASACADGRPSLDCSGKGGQSTVGDGPMPTTGESTPEKAAEVAWASELTENGVTGPPSRVVTSSANEVSLIYRNVSGAVVVIVEASKYPPGWSSRSASYC